MSDTLLDFIKHARQKGMDHATIRVLLLSAGWREKDVAKALAAEGLDIPVPEPPGAGGAKEAFQYLLALTALCFVVVNVIVIAFKLIDKHLPDPARAYEPYLVDFEQSAIRWSMAMLLVAFPLFFLFTRWIGNDLQKSLDKSKSPIRRWLTYLAMFAAAVTMTGDVVTLVFGFLQGDLTTRFLLQVLVVLVVSTIVFCYYLLSLRIPIEPLSRYLSRLDWTFGSVSALLVGLAVVTGFTLVDSPFQARLRRFDDRRIADLQEIKGAIERHVTRWQDGHQKQVNPLPPDLDELARLIAKQEYRHDLNLFDPVTGEKYGYAIKSDSSFELCAEFSRDDKAAGFWNHRLGKHCFVIDILNRD